MYDLSWKVNIGKYRLMLLESVEINHDVELLSDTAIIVLPATAYNKALEIESKIARGDKVTIQLGYDNELRNEFEGYVESIGTDGGSLRIVCEDGIFLYRVALENKELANISVKKLIEYVNKEVSAYYKGETPFTVQCDYDFSYGKFVIQNATGYDILKKIQEEAKPNVYLKDSVLHIHPQYSEIFGTAIYDFAVNIENANLKYKKAEDRRLLIRATCRTATGHILKAEVGTTGGDLVTIKLPGEVSQEMLTKLAKEALAKKVYTGYEGDFTSWLLPVCDAGYKVTLRDAEYEYKNGTYYVLGVKTKFDKSGGVRTIKVGKKLSG